MLSAMGIIFPILNWEIRLVWKKLNEKKSTMSKSPETKFFHSNIISKLYQHMAILPVHYITQRMVQISCPNGPPFPL